MKQILFFTFFLFLGLASCQSQSADKQTAAAPASYEDLDVAAFKAKMAEPGTVVLDVRTPAEIAAGKIEGAQELDFYNPNFREELAKLDKDKTYLVYCRSGNRSGKACQMMGELGFSKSYNLKGGYMAWSNQ